MLKIDNITIAYKDVPTVVDFSLDMGAPGNLRYSQITHCLSRFAASLSYL